MGCRAWWKVDGFASCFTAQIAISSLTLFAPESYTAVMIVHRHLLSIAFATLLALSGCRMVVPMDVWQPAKIESAVGKKILLSEVVGPTKVTDLLQERLVASLPQDERRKTTIAPSTVLQQNEAIRLVSATDDEPSDIALASAARGEGFDYVLRGEVIKERGRQTESAAEQFSVSWRLTELGDGGFTGGLPVVVNRESAIERYPDLRLVTDLDTLLISAAVRDTYRLFTPSMEKGEVELAIPYLLPGSKAIRKGNMAAHSGQWKLAKQIWTEESQKHGMQTAAIHNLALAAAAEQDFSTARELARKAVRRQPTKLHKRTVAWIELRQREYHKAFGLPDPPEGWFFTQ